MPPLDPICLDNLYPHGDAVRSDDYESALRLINLYRVVRSWDRYVSTFDMNTWFAERHDPDTGECGTAACAIGTAASSSWFKARGLTLRELPFAPLLAPTPVIDGEYVDEFELSKFFGIPREDALHLFYPTHYPLRACDANGNVTVDAVLLRIRHTCVGNFGLDPAAYDEEV